MNIVLADIQSLNLNPANTEASPPGEVDDFSNLVKNSLQNNPADTRQVIENKGLILNYSELEATGEALVPLSWMAYLPGAELTVTTDSEPVTIFIAEPAKPVPDIQHASISSSTIIDSDTSPVNLMAGESLPAVGKVLPPNDELIPSLPVTGQGLPVKHPDARVISTTGLSQELDSRDLQRPGLMPGEGRILAQGADHNTIADKLAESVPKNILEIQSGHHAQSDSTGARHIASTPVGTLTSFQANQSLNTVSETLNIVRPDSPVEWSHGLGDRLSWMINQKLNSATIRLDPPSLGKLEIHIQVTDESTKITINTQRALTRELIDNASLRLRDVLQEAGYQNVNVDVSHDRNQARSGAHQSASLVTGAGEKEDAQQEIGENIDSETGYLFNSDSLVDFFA